MTIFCCPFLNRGTQLDEQNSLSAEDQAPALEALLKSKAEESNFVRR